MKTYKPVGTSLIVDMGYQKQTKSGIILPVGASVDEALAVAKGKVVSIGDGRFEDKTLPCPAKVGDVVVFAHHAGDKITDELRVLGFRHIIAIENED